MIKDKDKSRIQSCVDHINTAVDVDPWAKELVAEMGKEILERLNNSKESSLTQKTLDAPDTNVGDMISRQTAIDALMKRDKALRNINWYDKPFAEGECRGIDEALEIVNNLPPAQSEKAQLSAEDATFDCISRQAAIDALDVLCQEHRYKIPGKQETYSQYNEAWQDALDRAEGAIGNLPFVQPEPCDVCVHKDDCGDMRIYCPAERRTDG